MSSICPRTDNSSAASKGSDINETIKPIVGDKDCVFVVHSESFLTKGGEIIEDFLLIDGLHLSASGTRRLTKSLGLSGHTAGKLDIKRAAGSAWNQTTKRTAARGPPTMAAARGTGAGRPARDGRGMQSVTGTPGPSTGAPWHQVQHRPRDKNRFPAVSLYHANARQLAKTDNDSHLSRYCHACGEANHGTAECKHPKPVSCHKCKRIGHKAKFCSMYYWCVGQGGRRADDVETLQCRYSSWYTELNTCDLRSQWPFPSTPDDSTIVHFTKEDPFSPTDGFKPSNKDSEPDNGLTVSVAKRRLCNERDLSSTVNMDNF